MQVSAVIHSQRRGLRQDGHHSDTILAPAKQRTRRLPMDALPISCLPLAIPSLLLVGRIICIRIFANAEVRRTCEMDDTSILMWAV